MSNVSTTIGVPFDCTGRFAGCERLMEVLRAARLIELFGGRVPATGEVLSGDGTEDGS